MLDNSIMTAEWRQITCVQEFAWICYIITNASDVLKIFTFSLNNSQFCYIVYAKQD
jgi:hypothetical protein